MIKLMTSWSISSKVLLEEAKKLGLQTEIISQEKNLFYVKSDTKKILFKSTDFWWNSSLAIKIANDKELTYKILEKNNIPIAKTIYIKNSDLDSFNESHIKNISFPVIIKPVNEWHGNGVMMNIISFPELKEKLSMSFKKYNTMILQEEIQGDEVRILVMKNEVILARNRIPAHVIGNGINTIKELIEKENKENNYRWSGYEKPLSYIEIDDEIISFLEKKELTLDSSPKEKEYIQLRWNSNIGTWGTMKDVTKEISKDIKKKCISACRILDMDICGVDVLTSDYTKPLHQTNWVILELNATPGIWWERELTNVNTGKRILEKLFF